MVAEHAADDGDADDEYGSSGTDAPDDEAGDLLAFAEIRHRFINDGALQAACSAVSDAACVVAPLSPEVLGALDLEPIPSVRSCEDATAMVDDAFSERTELVEELELSQPASPMPRSPIDVRRQASRAVLAELRRAADE